MDYEYVNPCEKGFIRIPVTRRQHNRMLPNRKQKVGAKIEYYWHPENNIFEAQYFCSAWMKVFLIVVMFIPAIFMQGFPETIRDIGNLIHEKKRGKFSADRTWKTDGELEKFIKQHVEGDMEQMRSDFEAVVRKKFGDLIDQRICKNSDGDYMAWDMRVAWWAWQAGRAAIEIELPKQSAYDDPLSAYNAINDCSDAIRAAGLRVKEK